VFLCSLINKNTTPAIAATPNMTTIAIPAEAPALKPLFVFVFDAAVEVDEVGVGSCRYLCRGGAREG
jgi:hypothetical protein